MNTNPIILAEITKEASQEQALSFLKDFYHAMKSEIKKRNTTTMQNQRGIHFDSISFFGEDFNLTVDIKGGMTL